jgi:hypothetical protein
MPLIDRAVERCFDGRGRSAFLNFTYEHVLQSRPRLRLRCNQG